MNFDIEKLRRFKPKTPMGKMLTFTLGVFFFLGFVKYLQVSAEISKHANFQPPPEAITSAKVVEMPWKDSVEVVGSLTATQGVTLSAEEAGKVAEINFESGSDIKQGDVMIRLDTSVEEARLASAEAMANLAKVTLTRAQTMRKNSTMSQSQFDQSLAEAERANAAVKETEAVINRKTVRAPFSGRAGIRTVNVGQYVNAGAPVVPLYSLDTLFLDLSLPQSHVSRLKIGDTLQFSVDLYGDRAFEGKITALDPQIDTNTRNFKVQATVQNQQHELRPGMFAKVKVTVGDQRNALVIPSSSINYAPYGNSVYVIEKQKDPKGNEYLGVRQQFVHTGETRGDLVVVQSGVKAGEEIATSGVFKLRPQAAVAINNSVKPGENLDPKPLDS